MKHALRGVDESCLPSIVYAQNLPCKGGVFVGPLGPSFLPRGTKGEVVGSKHESFFFFFFFLAGFFYFFLFFLRCTRGA